MLAVRSEWSGHKSARLDLVAVPALQPMLSLQHFCSAFSDNHARSHSIAGYDTRHDRSVSDTKSFDPINLEVTVDNGHGIAPHFGGTSLMRIRRGDLADEVLQVDTLQIAWHNFRFV